MSRWVRVTAVVAVLVLSGCLGALGPGAGSYDGDTDNHWRDDVVSVAYETPPNDTRNYEPAVREALVFWTEHSAEYAGYDVGFRFADPDERPDISVRFEPTVTDCGTHSEGDGTAGCAPVITAPRQVDRPVEVRVRTGLSEDSTAQVLKHELGHTLGLTHGDGPAVMTARSDLTSVPKPDATERDLPWADSDLVVHVETESLPESERDAAERQVGAAFRYYMAGAEGTVPGNVTFYRADSQENADITVRFADSDPCRSGPGSCGRTTGEDGDGDGNLEYYSHLEIALVDVDTDAVAWHVGRWLGTGFGHTTEEEFPEPLRASAGYDERRTEWWA